MPRFPMFLNLKQKRVLVIGGGRVALRKVKKLQEFEPEITVIAPRIQPEIKAYKNIIIEERYYQETDLQPRPEMVIVATDSEEINHKIARECHEKQIPVNVVDDPEYCSFQFPALVTKGKLSAGISTEGASPTAAAYFKEVLQRSVPEHLEEIFEWLETQRAELKEEISESRERARVLRELFEGSMEKGGVLDAKEISQCIQQKSLGGVTLVGAGCGKADLITLRGLRHLQNCQAVVYDDLIDMELLEYVPESAQRIYVGKRMGSHYASQEEINQKLIELAMEGLRVVRLKGGDPYLFGRGGEEMLALTNAGILCQEVPGIPSPIGIPAEYGIPVTHRGVSHSLHIITAHTSDTEDGFPKDFEALANLDGTLVFLMGLNQLPKIVERMKRAGKPLDTHVAILSGGNAPNPKCVRGTFADIEDLVKIEKVMAPAIILVGDVAWMNVKASGK